MSGKPENVIASLAILAEKFCEDFVGLFQILCEISFAPLFQGTLWEIRLSKPPQEQA